MTERRSQLSLITIMNHYTHWFGQFHQTLFFKTSFFSGALTLPATLNEMEGFRAFEQYKTMPAFVALSRLHDSLTEQAIALHKNRKMFGAPDLKRFAALWSSYEKLIAQLQKIEKNVAALESGILDPLTGVKIPDELLTTLAREIDKNRTAGTAFVTALVDVDHMARLNEIHSRDAGDFVLSEVAGRIAQDLRPYDEIFRMEDDKFFLLLKMISREHAMAVLQRIQRKVAVLPVALPDQREIAVNVTIGAAVSGPDIIAEQILDHSWRALTEAKTGRRAINADSGLTRLAFFHESANGASL